MRRDIHRTLAAGLAVLLALAAPLFVATAASADTSDFTFTSFDADFQLGRTDDGHSRLDVVETLVARYPDIDQNHGFTRAIPETNDAVSLSPRIESVTDAQGNPLTYAESSNHGFRELRIGDADVFVHGEVTYVIRYSLVDVVRAFENTGVDEFYWDVNGTGWAQPFDTVSTTVSVDSELADALTGATACYVTDALSCDLQSDGGGFSAAATGLAPGETLTVSIAFEPGTFEPGTPSGLSDETPIPVAIGAVAVMLAALGMLAFAIIRRVQAARSQRGGFVIAQYSVPKDLNIMLAAALVGRDRAALPAQFVSLAVRRNIRILAYPVRTGGPEYTLQYLSSDGVDGLELNIIRALFGPSPKPGDTRELDEDAALASALRGTAARAAALQFTNGLREKRVTIGCAPALLGVAAVALSIVNVIVGVVLGTFGMLAFLSVLFAGFCAVLTFVLSFHRRYFTPAGLEKRDYLLGMRVYLQLAEADRFRMLQSPTGAERVDVGNDLELVKLYEKLLPWAVLWGVETEWMRELEVKAASVGQSSDWFVGSNNDLFTTAAFAGALSSIGDTASYNPATTSSWSSGGSDWSSSSGGSDGGGSAGDGGGGGGGDGW